MRFTRPRCMALGSLARLKPGHITRQRCKLGAQSLDQQLQRRAGFGLGAARGLLAGSIWGSARGRTSTTRLARVVEVALLAIHDVLDHRDQERPAYVDGARDDARLLQGSRNSEQLVALKSCPGGAGLHEAEQTFDPIGLDILDDFVHAEANAATENTGHRFYGVAELESKKK